MTENSVVNAIKIMIERFGTVILIDSNKSMSMLKDLAPSCKNEIILLKHAFDNNLVEDLVNATSFNEQQRAVIKMYDTLTSVLRLSEDAADEICNDFVKSLNLDGSLIQSHGNNNTSSNNNSVVVKKTRYNENNENSVGDKKQISAMLNNDFKSNSTNLKQDEEFIIQNNVLIKYHGEKLKVRIPYGVVTIGEKAFWFNDIIKQILISKSVVNIERMAFSYCKSLESVNIPSNVLKIGEASFQGCTNLKSVQINDGVKRICASAFQDCPQLTNVVIPPSVTIIGGDSFDYENNIDFRCYRGTEGENYLRYWGYSYNIIG